MEKRNITIYDIAKEAGVSPATVSRVLTNSARVSRDKSEKIHDLIKKYDFKPNALARGLSDTRTRIIGVLTADIRNPFYASLFVECEKAANERGYTVLLCNSLNDNELEEGHLEKLVQQRVDAIIQVGGRVDELISDASYVEHVNRVLNSIPVIITGKLDGSDCYQVNIDEKQAMELVLNYLIELGHEEIALIGGRKNVKSTYDKHLRFIQLLNRHSIEYQEDLIIEGKHYDDVSGYECMNSLFDKGKIPTAVIAINDFTAIGVMRAIVEHGLAIPGDISVTSFDNTFVSNVSSPKLTSVAYDYQLFGKKLIDTAIRAIENENPPRIQLIGSELVIRDSCKRREK